MPANQPSTRNSKIQEAIGLAMPRPGQDVGKYRSWKFVVQTERPLPAELSKEQVGIQERLQRELQEAFVESEPEIVQNHPPGVSLIRLGEVDILVDLSLPFGTPPVDIEIPAVWKTIAQIKERWGLLSLQGIPAAHWGVLRMLTAREDE